MMVLIVAASEQRPLARSCKNGNATLSFKKQRNPSTHERLPRFQERL